MKIEFNKKINSPSFTNGTKALYRAKGNYNDVEIENIDIEFSINITTKAEFMCIDSLNIDSLEFVLYQDELMISNDPTDAIQGAARLFKRDDFKVEIDTNILEKDCKTIDDVYIDFETMIIEFS